MVRFISASVICLVLAPMAQAQLSGNSLPAEFPPTSYTGNQYVDSNGCAFVRAGLSGAVTWVPRVRADRTPLCGQTPTLIEGSAPTVPDAPEMAMEPMPEADAESVASSPSAEQPAEVASAAAPAPAPAPVAAPVATPPVPAVPARFPGPTSAPVPAPAPIVAAPMAPPRARRPGDPIETVASVVTPPRIGNGATPPPAAQTSAVPYAQACAGLSGLQPQLISRTTGQPIDCGPGQNQAAAQAQAQNQVAAPVSPVSPVSTGAPRMTLSQACAMAAQSGRTIINQTTGRPIDCGADAATATVASATVPPSGYRGVWEDGRVNPQRGTSSTVASATVPSVSAPVTPVVRTPATTAASGGYFVQVGTYGVPSNADRAVARVRAVGYPVALASMQRNGQVLRAVAMGPFGDAASVNAALAWARSAGYTDAFVRR